MTPTIELTEADLQEKFKLDVEVDVAEIQKRLHRTEADLQAALGREQTLEQTRAFIAHEFRHAIVPLSVYAQMLAEELAKPAPNKDRLAKLTERIIKHTHIASDVVDEYVDYSRPLKPDFEPIDLIQLLPQAVDEFHAECVRRGVFVQQVYDYVEVSGITVKLVEASLDKDKMEITGDRRMLLQVFRNLISNAIEAMPNGGRLAIMCMYNKREWAQISIFDSGSGFNEEHIKHAFELGFTTKSGKRGAGIGLALSQRLIEDAHHGIIKLSNYNWEDLGKGVRVIISLPVTQEGFVNAE